MKFKREWLQDLVNEDCTEAKIIKNDIYETSRWSISYGLVFEYQNKYYKTFYSRGATECQDEHPFEYDEDEINCIEVIPVIETVVVYKPKDEVQENNKTSKKSIKGD